jgi:hypothetical protein
MNMPYQVYQAERPKTREEQRRDDARRGELAETLSGLWHKLAITPRPDDPRRCFPESGPSAPSVESLSPISDSHICVEVVSGCH